MDSSSLLTQSEWQQALAGSQEKAALLFGRPEAEQKKLGYFHTLREICQQPWTWLRTCEQMIASRAQLQEHRDGVKNLVFTGSGRSE